MILSWNTFYCVLSYISETHTRSLTQLSTVTENKHPDEGDNISKRYTSSGEKLGQRWDFTKTFPYISDDVKTYDDVFT